MARVGGIISLLIAPLGKMWKPLPMTIMGTVAVIAGVFAIAFPETTGIKLPETITEALAIGKKETTKPFTGVNGVHNDAYQNENKKQ